MDKVKFEISEEMMSLIGGVDFPEENTSFFVRISCVTNSCNGGVN